MRRREGIGGGQLDRLAIEERERAAGPLGPLERRPGLQRGKMVDADGQRGAAAPKLKDVALGPKEWEEAYIQTFRIMHTMFHQCRLVHGDLSEYNLIYHQVRGVMVIDVGQVRVQVLMCSLMCLPLTNVFSNGD
jgi:hypothetical protein